MKILIWQPVLRSVSGVTTHTYILAENFAKRGHQVIIGTWTKDPGRGHGWVPHPILVLLIRFFCRGTSDYIGEYRVLTEAGLLDLLKLVRSSDIIHMQGFDILCYAISKLVHKPIVWDHHNYDLCSPSGIGTSYPGVLRYVLQNKWKDKELVRLTLFLFRRLVKNTVAHHVVHSKYVAGNTPVAKSSLIYLGIDTDFFSPRQVQMENSFFFLYGRMGEGKGEEYLLKATKILLSEGTVVYLRLAGSFARVNPRDIIKRYELEENVQYLGEQRREVLQDLISRACAVVVPTLYEEPTGMVAIEGLSCGKPVIASRVGGLAEFPEDCVLYVEPANVEELAGAMRELALNHSRAVEMGKRGRQYVIKKNSLQMMVEKYITLYEKVLGRKNTPQVRLTLPQIKRARFKQRI